MPQFCAFTRHRNSTKLLINRDLVRAVSYDGSAGGTVILFDAAHSIIVSESLEAVAERMNDRPPELQKKISPKRSSPLRSLME